MENENKTEALKEAFKKRLKTLNGYEKILLDQKTILDDIKESDNHDTIIDFDSFVHNLAVIVPEYSWRLIDVISKMNDDALTEIQKAIHNLQK